MADCFLYKDYVWQNKFGIRFAMNQLDLTKDKPQLNSHMSLLQRLAGNSDDGNEELAGSHSQTSASQRTLVKSNSCPEFHDLAMKQQGPSQYNYGCE